MEEMEPFNLVIVVRGGENLHTHSQSQFCTHEPELRMVVGRGISVPVGPHPALGKNPHPQWRWELGMGTERNL